MVQLNSEVKDVVVQSESTSASGVNLLTPKMSASDSFSALLRGLVGGVPEEVLAETLKPIELSPLTSPESITDSVEEVFTLCFAGFI